MANNHVIFIHPDGTSPSHYALARFVQEGPDGRLNWDSLEQAGVYLGHMEDQLGGTSNGGAVTHATGAKVYAESFGLEQDGSEITPLSGNTGFTIVEEAIEAGKVTALVQSGAIYEPGTAAFVAETGEIEVDGETVVPRGQRADIAKQVIESGVDFIMAGGEVTLLPIGTDGFHGTAEEYDSITSDPVRRPTENLIELAESLSYTVVYTREQLNALLDLPEPPQKVLGVFAPDHTFNDRSEEFLAEQELPLYTETAPTIAEMLEVTQQLMEAHPNFDNGSIAIVEEEGTDNFGNNNNAAGVLEGVIRADAAIGVAQDFLGRHDNTLIVTAADSDAGGLQVRDPVDEGDPVGTINNNPTLNQDRPVPLDGVDGSNTLPFVSAPDADGDVFPFGVTWAGTPDFPGAIVSKAEGLNAEKLPATLDNTGIYELMYETLFDVELESRTPAPTPAPEATEDTGNVIFIHPDGTTPTHFAALRNIEQGPDGRTNWDMLSDAGVYLGHMEDRLTGTSNGGAVTHANGVKVFNESFGLDVNNDPIVPASGNVGQTIMEEAVAAGKGTALIQSGDIGEPGTAAFVAATTNRDPDPDVRARDKAAEIAEQVIRSGVDVIMAGGEVYMLPQGTTGFHVTAEIDAAFDDLEDRPSENLIELAESLGYTVVYTEDQMNAAVNSDAPPEKLLGVFAADDIFDDQTEEELGLNTADPSPLYLETAPTVGEMLEASLKIIGDDPDGFYAVVEEEGTDNFGNNNNAVGTIEAVRRADEAIGVAKDYVDNTDPNTLVLTAADSDGGGLQTFQFAPYNRPSGNAISDPALGDEETDVPFIYAQRNLGPGTPVFLDGQTGSTGSEEFPWQSFPAMDSIDGPMGNFGVVWTGTPDVPGSIVSKAYGLNAEQLPSTLDNTFIYEMMYGTLFGGLDGPVTSELEGFASLPADTFTEGPPAGGDDGDGNPIDANGRTGPFDGQPVQGFSGVQFAPGGDGSTFWFLSDNGFGAKANSSDYLLRLYQVDPDFVGSEGGDGDIDVQGFVQLSDPDNLIPFDIQNEGSSDRHLTGSDFDIESFTIDTNGDIWVGDEFGPYMLHFDSEGKLLEAPIPTPNITNFNTLDGSAPLVIGHRGASGALPEHTLEAYQLAMQQGADFVEPDLAITKDGVLIARHEPLLDDTTNVADLFGSDRMSTKMLDGEEITGYFAEDFTLAEIKQLRAVQSRDFRSPEFDGIYEIPTLQEVIELVQQFEADTGKQVGIYPETKHPTFFDEQGLSLEEPLIETLQATGFTDPNRIFIQSFELQNLIELKTELLPAAGLEDLPLVQLFGDVESAFINDGGGGFSVPYDFVANAGKSEEELRAIYGDLVDQVDFSSQPTYADLFNQEAIDVISTYADGLGPWKNSFVLREALDEPVDGDGDGIAEITTQLTGEIRPLVDYAHNAGMQVHPYTLRNEERFLTLNADGTPQTAEEEFIQLTQIGVDGFFTDFPKTGAEVVERMTAATVLSPDNPDVLNGPADPNLPRSRGYEGMAFSPDRQTLYPMLEGTVEGDPEGSLRIYEFDAPSSSFEGLVGLYQMDDPSHAIGDFTPVNETEFLVIERDGGQGEDAEFKKIFKVDLSDVDDSGFVLKEELVDLLDITDPNDLNSDGDSTFDFPFVTIEDVLVLDEDTLLVANDNNYPFSVGRGPDIDNNEIIQIKLSQPLDLDPRLGAAALGGDSSSSIDFEGSELTAGTVISDQLAGVTVSTDGPLAMIFDSGNPTGGDTDLASDVFGNVLILSEDGDSSDPDDNAAGGTFQFTFDDLVNIKSVGFLDVEENGGQIDLFGADGSSLGTVDISNLTRNGEAGTAAIEVPAVSRMDVMLAGGGAITNIMFA